MHRRFAEHTDTGQPAVRRRIKQQAYNEDGERQRNGERTLRRFLLRKDFRQPLMALLSPRTPLPNLWLTGQNLALHGVHGVTMTALQTCAELLGKEWIWNNVLNK